MSLILKDSLKNLRFSFQKPWEWRIGGALIASFLAARGLGLFANLELTTLDFFLSNRIPEEREDKHTVIVLVDEDQFQDGQAVSDEYLTDLIEGVFFYEPAVIGLNIFTGEADNKAARSRLVNLFKNHENLIGVQKVLPPEETPPPNDFLKVGAGKQFGNQ